MVTFFVGAAPSDGVWDERTVVETGAVKFVSQFVESDGSCDIMMDGILVKGLKK